MTHALHKRKICINDLKLENILIDRNFRARLADFNDILVLDHSHEATSPITAIQQKYLDIEVCENVTNTEVSGMKVILVSSDSDCTEQTQAKQEKNLIQ